MIRTDVAVVGGGIIGLATAHALLECGRSVTLLDARVPGQGATQAAGGMLAPVSEADVEDPRLVAFGLESLAGYAAWTANLERQSGVACEYRDDGALWVARRHDDMAEIEHLATTLAMRELPFERLDAKGVLEREPRLAPTLVGGLAIPADHQVNPRAVARALATALRSAGATLYECTPVEALVGTGEGRWQVASGDVTVDAAAVVVATGAARGGALHPALAPFAQRPVKGQGLLPHAPTQGPPLLRHVVRTPEVYLIPRDDGGLYIGATVEEMGFDDRPTAGATMDLLRRAWQTLPGVYESALDTAVVGLRPAADDHLPFIGPVDDAPGLFVSLGHYRNGILLAPASARHLARAIVDGVPPAELEPFLPARASGAATDSAGSPA